MGRYSEVKSNGGSGKLGIRKDMNWVNESKKLVLGPHGGSLFLTQLRMDCQVRPFQLYFSC